MFNWSPFFSSFVDLNQLVSFLYGRFLTKSDPTTRTKIYDFDLPAICYLSFNF